MKDERRPARNAAAIACIRATDGTSTPGPTPLQLVLGELAQALHPTLTVETLPVASSARRKK